MLEDPAEERKGPVAEKNALQTIEENEHSEKSNPEQSANLLEQAIRAVPKIQPKSFHQAVWVKSDAKSYDEFMRDQMGLSREGDHPEAV